jgi:ATP-dependent DNA helicase DinG
MAAQPGAWIFTSATLAVGPSFEHFAARLGLTDYAALRLDSPFDFARNALLYHPPELPDPAASHYTTALLNAVLPVLNASQGRAFLLFTSYRALREAADWLAERLPYPLLVPGALPKVALLQQFRDLGNAVLLGTASFWEGVDVRGEALSCVIIDRLPFAAPNDPVLQARIEALRQRGENPFMTYQLPQAVITLKQGAGRLIRDVSDRGVLVLGDPRLLSKSYGQAFLDSLPPMPRTRLLERVQAFFAA